MSNYRKSSGGSRMAIGLPLAAMVTAGLFLGMGTLIKNDDDIVLAEQTRPLDPITPQRTETDPPERLEKVDTTLPPEPTRDSPLLEDPIGKSEIEYTTPKPTPATPGEFGGVTITINDAIVKPAPSYPNSCLNKGIEGTATVMFDVTQNGVVTNARVIDATNSCFKEASLRAIRGWKFQVSGRGGNGIAQRGIQKTFRFQITQ